MSWDVASVLFDGREAGLGRARGRHGFLRQLADVVISLEQNIFPK